MSFIYDDEEERDGLEEPICAGSESSDAIADTDEDEDVVQYSVGRRFKAKNERSIGNHSSGSLYANDKIQSITSSLERSWNCQRCTMVNAIEDLRCVICEEGEQPGSNLPRSSPRIRHSQESNDSRNLTAGKKRKCDSFGYEDYDIEDSQDSIIKDFIVPDDNDEGSDSDNDFVKNKHVKRKTDEYNGIHQTFPIKPEKKYNNTNTASCSSISKKAKTSIIDLIIDEDDDFVSDDERFNKNNNKKKKAGYKTEQKTVNNCIDEYISEDVEDSDSEDPFFTSCRRQDLPTPSFPEMSETFWTVQDVASKSFCQIDFRDFMLNDVAAGSIERDQAKRQISNEKKKEKKEKQKANKKGKGRKGSTYKRFKKK